ncbi:MAG: penicillin acylase family protein, partial [Verrucomicrobiota bacterium]
MTIHHDAFAVPHIRAQTDADLFSAPGMQHAFHRCFQMDMLRRALSGRLAETLGDRPVPAGAGVPGGGTMLSDADRFMRTLDLVGAARGVWARADVEGRGLLRAYAEGVNHAQTILRRRRPIEYRALRLPIRPWRPLDSILVAKGMALGLSFKWRTAPVFARIAAHLAESPVHFEHLLPRTPGFTGVPHGHWMG